MSFEFKNPKPWENKKSTIFKEWLNKEMKQNPENWGQDFREYVEIKTKEGKGRKDSHKSNEEEKKEKTFERYLGGLNLTEQEIQGKSILDIGCKDGEFVVSCMEKGITQKVYGMDRKLEEGALDEKYRDHFFSQDFTKEFPVKNLDYIVSAGAVSLYLNEFNKSKVEKTIAKAIEAINGKGEIRIWPIKKALRGRELEGIKEQERIVDEIMKKFEAELNIAWKLEATDIRVSGIDKDVWAEQVLIIKKI